MKLFLIVFFVSFFVGIAFARVDEVMIHKKIFKTSFSVAFLSCLKDWLKRMCCPCFFISKKNKNWWSWGDHYDKQYITCRKCGYYVRVYK